MSKLMLNKKKDIMGIEKISKAFNRKALMPFVTAGDPDLATSKQIIKTLDKKGADIIEIGIPFSDPLADGPVIQDAGQRALAGGITLAGIFKMLKDIKDEIKAPYLLMGYYNSILNYGKQAFISDALQAGVAGVIIPDLPFDQDPEFYDSLNKNKIAGILMVTPVTSKERLIEITKHSTGFLYCVSLLGITGDRRGPMEQVTGYLKKIRSYSNLPLALGFGIDSPGKVKKIIDFVDGVIIGSALVKIIQEQRNTQKKLITSVGNFITEIKAVMLNK